MTAYLQTWTDGAHAALSRQGEELAYAASNQYRKIGLAPGDLLYIAFLQEGYLHLIGRLQVAEVIDRAKAVRRPDPPIWDSKWVAVAQRGHPGSRVRSREVPVPIVRRLEFVRATGVRTRLQPDAAGRIDGKALQAIRRLTPESGELLNDLF